MLLEAPWTRTPEHILQHYAVDPARGLSDETAAKHAELYGRNGAQNYPCVRNVCEVS